MLGNHVGKRKAEAVSDYCVFDLETTGISANSDQVIEISAVKVIGGKVEDTFSTLVNPGRPIPYQASCVNHITDDMVAGAPSFEKALQDFLQFAGDLVLVGHNIASFDLKFLYRDAEKFWGKTVANDYIDTLPLARRVLPGRKGYKLVDLADYYGISQEGAHRALNDCVMNQLVYAHLCEDESKMPKAAAAEAACPKCGCEMVKRSGRFGVFWGCSGYPVCRFTRNL